MKAGLILMCSRSLKTITRRLRFMNLMFQWLSLKVLTKILEN